MSYLFSSESVSEGHPDKVSDQISDALLDQFLAYDENARCAIESFCTTGQVCIMGEVSSTEYIDLQAIARRTINKIGYTKAEYMFDGNSLRLSTSRVVISTVVWIVRRLPLLMLSVRRWRITRVQATKA